MLIHKCDDTSRAKKYDPILQELKLGKFIKQVGAGDVTSAMDDHFKDKVSFEINARALFLGPDAEALVYKLNKSGKPVFVYNIVNTAKLFLGDNPSKDDITGFINMIHGKVKLAEPILSSGKSESIKENLGAVDIEDYGAVGESRDKLEKGVDREQKKLGVPLTEMKEEVKLPLRELLKSYDWLASDLFDVKSDYQKHMQKAMELFKENELQVVYVYESKVYMLRTLIEMLFDSAGNCHRVDASNFLGIIQFV